MKKTITALLALIAAASLAGCEKTADNIDETTSVQSTATEAAYDTSQSPNGSVDTDNRVNNSITPEKVKTMEAWAGDNAVIPDIIPQFVQGDMKIRTAQGALEHAPYKTTFPPKFRDCYYWGQSVLYDLVDNEAFGEWYNAVVQPDIDSNAEPQEMYTVSFVKYFQISRDDFDRCCEAKRERMESLRDEHGHDITGEGAEIPNGDIIYTFDNEIINSYYLRDQSGIVYYEGE